MNLRIVIFSILGSACGQGVHPSSSHHDPLMVFKPMVIKQVSVKELQPLRLTLPASIDEHEFTSLPPGAIHDVERREFLWLPQRGQEGSYEIPLFKNQRLHGSLLVDVEAVTDETLNAGPFDFYQDGDVGYVYVHGMSQFDSCEKAGGAWSDWQKTADVLSPDPNHRTAVCYDGRRRVDEQARKVAQQIVSAPCGRFNKCIIVAHSMGGLMTEYILLNARDESEVASEERELYKAVKHRVLFVIATGSAAGGSKLANIVKHPDRYPGSTKILAAIGKLLPSQDAIDNLQVDYASRVAAPIDADPAVPFFSVIGYSKYSGVSVKGFNGRLDLATMDHYARFSARSDGLVSFRSACGIASDREDDGPGQKTPLAEQLEYCFNAPRKASHFVWFTINLHHGAVNHPFGACGKNINGCEVHSYRMGGEGYQFNEELSGQDAVRIMRSWLTRGLPALAEEPEVLEL